MRITFYKDNVRKQYNRLLCLPSEMLARGYIRYLRSSLEPEAQKHVRVTLETVADEKVVTEDITLDEFERRMVNGA